MMSLAVEEVKQEGVSHYYSAKTVKNRFTVGR